MPSSLKTRAVLALSVLVLFSCTNPSTRFPAGYEFDDHACSDHRDNDGDGLSDCFDPDCLMNSTVCGLIIPVLPQPPHVEDSPELCADRVDNDGNGQFDCGDRACQAVPEACCGREFDDTSCRDGIDNDQNGFIDCEDFGCRSGRFVVVCDRETDCGDSRDNDADDAVDCADSDCYGIGVCPVPTEAGACTDGADNDHDRQTDCCDPDCSTDPACSAAVDETTAVLCGNGLDDDCDGYADCADFSCTSASRGAEPDAIALCAMNAEDTLAKCMDGIDNDGNGFIDCDDFSCARAMDAMVASYCANAGEGTAAKCSDGVDNDGNGYVDCADNGCKGSTDPAVLAVCFEDIDPVTGVTNPANCHDMIDNDGDGSVDCADFDCAENPATAQARIDGGVPDDKCEGVLPRPVNETRDGDLMTTRHRLASLSFACVLLASAHASAQQPDGGAPPPVADAGGIEAPPVEGGGGIAAPEAHETNCGDRRDDDGDGLVDCADSDCFHGEECESGGAHENTDDRCSDWIDNDGDGAIDCDDDDCQGPGVTRCHGSWHGPAQGGAGQRSAAEDAIPDLAPNQSIEDLIGTHGDIDGERTDEVCADGVDNDGDGRTDCQDFGCRFDPAVTVCSPTPGLRFSAFAGVAFEYLRDEVSGNAHSLGLTNPPDGFDVNFARVELRVLGPLPLIQNSFFQITVRLENTPRLTWAIFQVPLGGGHSFNVNSGGGSLSVDLISGARKQLLLTPAYYEYSAYEQGNGASAEVAGPVTTDGRLQYRLFVGGGSGQFNGNVGGRFFRADNTNFTYTGGGQLQLNILGRYSRFETPFMWQEARSPTIAVVAGAKWDQRAQERYFAWYGFAVARAWRFELRAETYGKTEFAFNYGAESWRAQLALLLVDKLLLLGADVGGYYPGTPTMPTSGFSSATIQRPLQEFQYRVALHLNLFREMVRLSLVWTDHYIQANPDPGHLADTVHEQILHLEMQYMF